MEVYQRGKLWTCIRHTKAHASRQSCNTWMAHARGVPLRGTARGPQSEALNGNEWPMRAVFPSGAQREGHGLKR